MRSIIYITNTQLPSQKANAYQSLCMCEAFSLNSVKVALWHPARQGDYAYTNEHDGKELVKTIYKQNGITDIFQLKRLFSIDSLWLKRQSKKIWFYVQSFSFWLACIIALQRESSQSVIFIRDTTALVAFSTAKKLGLLRQNLIFEAHRYSKSIAKHMGAANHFIVISDQLKRLYYPNDESKQIIVAHDAVKEKELLSIQDDAIALNLRKKQEERVVLYIGNLFPWKGVYLLADCIQHLPQHYRIVFVGGSEDTLPAFRTYTAKFSRIDVIGFRPRNEIRSYLCSADVLILPNSAQYELSHVTSPLKLFEYMAAQKPIVASRLPSIQEILQDQKNAILFSPDDAQELADKIQWAVSNDCSSLVRKAWQDVQMHTWNERAKQIIHTIGLLEPAHVEA